MSEQFYIVRKINSPYVQVSQSYDKAANSCNPGDELLTVEVVLAEKCVQPEKKFITRGIHGYEANHG